MHPSLSALAAYRQFVVYRIVPSTTRAGKSDKFPCDYRTGQKCDAHNPANWTDAATAEGTAAAWGDGWGVGFVFTEGDPFWFLDIDGCAIDGQWSPLAQQVCSLLPGCAIEVSQSRTGLHIIGSGRPPAHGCTNKALGLEFYHSGRFVALTGIGALGDAATDATAVLPALVATYFPSDASGVTEAAWSDGPTEEWNGPVDDADLLRRAMQSKSVGSAFGNRAAFADLWLGNETVLGVAYPDGGGRAYDHSAADAALAQHLAFWTGKDCERISRLMQGSSLAREKWEREDYLPRTIRGAVSRQEDVCKDKPAAAPAVPLPPDSPVTERGGDGFMNPAQQLSHFAGCVYVKSQHKALVPGGVLMKPESFKVHYGGYQFFMDAQNSKASRDAWEAWTQNQVYRCPQAEGICFRPELAPGAIVDVSGQRFVNSYFPVPIARKAGDASPFTAHLAKVLPDESDRAILLAYMAACVQHQGIKFQWAPLLQGVEGNGKTLFSRCVAEAIGHRYVHFPPANEISEKFNSWLFGNIFIGVEDIYVPNQRQEVFEILKPMITSDRLAKRAMQTDQVMSNVVANFMFNSNHRDAIKKTANDRRICNLFCDQQSVEDLTRDGMVGDYFTNLYSWLKGDGYAIVSEFLYTYTIPAALNPAGECQRAPRTSSTEEAIAASAGSVEQEIEEAVAQGLQGFCGGWISTIWLEKLLERMKLAGKVSRHKRKEILEQMGYRHHPALKDGRVNNIVMPDGNKPHLFCRKDSLLLQITNAAAVAKDYETANTGKLVVNLPFAQSR